MELSLTDARLSTIDRMWFTNVYPLYIHDLTEFDDGFYDLDEQGVWQPDYLPSWLNESCDRPWLINVNGERAGFALINQAPCPYMTPGVDYRMSEFFILRRWRRHQIGQRAAVLTFQRFRGLWELSVLQRNTGALAFWRHLIAEYTEGRYTEQPVQNTIGFNFRT